MEQNIASQVATYKINTTNSQIDQLPDDYIVKILIKLRMYLRKGPLNDSVEPYVGAFNLRGNITPFGDKKFHVNSTDVVLIPGSIGSFFNGTTFFMPDNVYEMISEIQLEIPAKSKLKRIYQRCLDAAENDSIVRSRSTQQFYNKTLCKFIELMVFPQNKAVYDKLTSSSFDKTDEFLQYLYNKLLRGANNDRTNPYNLGTFGGVTIQTSEDTVANVPTHVHLLISDIKDPLRDCQKKCKKFFFRLIDAIISSNSERHFTTQHFYEDLLKDFAEKIIPNNNPQSQNNLRRV